MCSTIAPGWMRGSHPTVAEGVVTRKVCYHFDTDCCTWSNNISVKNCGGYFVYKLEFTPNCYSRYCGNGGAGKLPMQVMIVSLTVSVINQMIKL